MPASANVKGRFVQSSPISEVAPGLDALEGDGRDAHALLDLDRLGVEGQEPHRVCGHVDEARDLAAAVAQDLPIGVASDLEVLARAAAQVDERVVEGAGVEEALEPGALDARELPQFALLQGELLGRRLERGVGRQSAAIFGLEAFNEETVDEPFVSVVGVEVDGGLEPVAETVDVGGVGVDVLTQGVRVLEQKAEGVGVVRRRERPGLRKRGLALAGGRA